MNSSIQRGSTHIMIQAELEFPHLMVPCTKGFYDGQYSASVKIPKSDVSTVHQIEDATNAASIAKWGCVAEDLKKPLKDGDLRASGYSTFEDAFYLDAHSKTKPLVVDRRRRPIGGAREIPFGSICNFALEFRAYDMDGKRGVSCKLIGVQLVETAQQDNGGGICLFDDLGEDEDDGEIGPVPVGSDEDDSKFYNRPRNY